MLCIQFFKYCPEKLASISDVLLLYIIASTSRSSAFSFKVKFTGSQSVVTCSLFIENSGRLICGLGDGTIVIIPVMHTLRMLLLSQTGTKTSKWVI